MWRGNDRQSSDGDGAYEQLACCAASGGEKGHLFIVVGAWVEADSGDFGFGHGGFDFVASVGRV